MDCVTPVMDVAARLWSCTSRHASYILDLEENVSSLRIEMEELRNVVEDVKGRVEYAEKHQMRRRSEVNIWLNNVGAMEREVNQLLEKCDQEIQKKCLSNCCSKNHLSTYKIGKTVCTTLKAVSELKGKGHFDVVADCLPTAAVDEKPVEIDVGLDSTFEKIWSWIEDEQVRIIGLYGMGGVGKTTLLKRINNEFLKIKLGFDVVIWVVVSKPANAEKVQEVILNRLEIPRHNWENRSKDEKGQQIFNILKTQKFVILLDDIWERLDLTEVGIPHPNGPKKSKLVFTTRSEDVCHVMEAHKHVKVECLAEDLALALFRLKVGDDTFNSHPEIPKLAKQIVEECKGLPLALVTIGRAMVNKKAPEKWDHAVQVLKTYPSSFSGMEDQVFPKLAFSYDSLRDETTKSCFLYCSMFPTDYEILEDELIELWIGEGFFSHSYYNIQVARIQGCDVIESLKVACLLESGESEKHIKMHDMIRDMALWLTCKNEEKKKKVVVKERAWMIEHRDFAEWKEAQMISLWDIGRLSLFDRTIAGPVVPSFPKLGTLLLRRSSIDEFPSGFFEKMPLVRVLDLSRNYSLQSFGEFYFLVNLEYLNMSFTSIRALSEGGLKNLRCLILDFTHIKEIGKGFISSLSSLELFSMHGGSHDPVELSIFDEIKKGNVLCGGKMALLEELESLNYINEISLILHSNISVKKLLSSHKLRRCIRKLHLQCCRNMISLQLPSLSVGTMWQLELLQISSCDDLLNVQMDVEDRGNNECLSRCSMGVSAFHKLHEVHIISCSKLRDLSWLIHAPCLQLLAVSACESMEEVIGDKDGAGRAIVEQHSGLFSRLAFLQLEHLPRLKSICSQVLSLPSLRMVYVHSCESLKKLPFDSNTGKNSLKKIQAQKSWWEGLQWEDESIKQKFNRYFMPSEYLDLYQILGYGY